MATVRWGVVLALVLTFGAFDARSAQAQCSYTVSPMTVSVPSTGSAGSLLVITGSSCAWTAVSSVSWVTITSNASATGLASANYTVAANPAGGTRVGTVLIAGRTVTITQGAGSCSYSVSPTSASVPSTGTNASLAVTTGSSCAWTTVSTVGWITITSGASMAGLGSANYTVAANTSGGARTGTIAIAGQTVTITQAANSCTYSVSPTSASVPSTGTNASLAVTTGSSCAWTTVSAVGWITITSGASMAGLGSANYTVAANTSGIARTGTIAIAGQTVTITQEGRRPPAAPTGFRIVTGS